MLTFTCSKDSFITEISIGREELIFEFDSKFSSVDREFMNKVQDKIIDLNVQASILGLPAQYSVNFYPGAVMFDFNCTPLMLNDFLTQLKSVDKVFDLNPGFKEVILSAHQKHYNDLSINNYKYSCPDTVKQLAQPDKKLLADACDAYRNCLAEGGDENKCFEYKVSQLDSTLFAKNYDLNVKDFYSQHCQPSLSSYAGNYVPNLSADTYFGLAAAMVLGLSLFYNKRRNRNTAAIVPIHTNSKDR
jgi:hypothetical protein